MTHYPGHVATTDTSGGTGSGTIADYVGATLFDQEGNSYLVKTRVDRNKGRVYWMSAPNGRAYNADAAVWQNATGQILQFSNTGSLIGERTLTESERAGGLGGSGGGGGGSAPAYSSTRQAQQEAQAFQAQQAELDRQYQREQLAAEQEMFRQRQEAERRQNAINRFTELVAQFSANQQQATEALSALGPRPFRFAAASQMMPVLGTEPQAGFEQALQGFIDRPLPTLNANAPIRSIEAASQGLLGGSRIPLPPNIYGMADGGFVSSLGQPQARLVGEEGPEVMLTSPEGVQILPLNRGMARGGSVQFDKETLYAGLSPLFAGLGFSGYPKAGNAFRAGALGSLGVRPGFMRVQDPTGRGPERFFIRDPQSDALREISAYYVTGAGARGSGLPSLESAVPVRGMGEAAKLGTMGRGLSTAELPAFQKSLMAPRPVEPFADSSVLFRDPTTGVALPSLRRIAPILRRLMQVNPALAEIALGAYDSPFGVPRSAIEGVLDLFNLPGQSPGLLRAA